MLKKNLKDRSKTEKALAESENHLRTIIEAEPECVKLLNKKYELLEMNKAGLEMIEADYPEQVIGKSVLGIIDKPYRKKFAKLTERVFKGQSGIQEFEITGLKGTRRWLETHAVPLKNIDGNITSLLSITRDITDRKKAEKEQRKALKRYEILAKATSDTIWDWDMVNNQIRYNEGIKKMFGYDPSDVESLSDWWKMNIHPDDSERIFELMDIAFRNKLQTIQMEYRYRCAHDTYKNILDRAFITYNKNGRPIQMTGAMQDVTHQKEEEMRINKAIIDAQEAERQQIGMELHDNVNQVLSAALIYLGMLKDDEIQNPANFDKLQLSRNYINNAVQEIRRLSHQLAPTSFEKVSLKDVFVSLINNINADERFEINLQFEDKGIDSISEEVKINLYRILQEQLNNIVKYSAASSVGIELTMLQNSVRLQISDNGRGFNPKTIKKGIGLENIRRRVKMHKGEFTIRSSVGNGCEIIAEIPLIKNE